jgi:hypothetical protein
MEALIGAAIGAVAQVLAALLLALVVWGGARLLARLRQRPGVEFRAWLGLLPTGRPAWHLGLVVAAAAAVGCALTLGGHTLVPGDAELVTGPDAPYGKVARMGGPPVVLAGALLRDGRHDVLGRRVAHGAVVRGFAARRMDGPRRRQPRHLPDRVSPGRVSA